MVSLKLIVNFYLLIKFHTILLLESFDVGTLVGILFDWILFVVYIDLLIEVSGIGIWFVCIWLLLFGVCTFGNFTDWLVALLFPLYWLFLFITLFDATILLFPVTNAGFWFWFTAWERFLFFCCSSSFVFYSLA